LYSRIPGAEELEESGFLAEDFASDPVDVFPENVAAFNLFCSVRTQFRIGMNGPTGLDYMVVFHKLDRMNLEPEEYAVFEADIQTMEYAALAKMSEKN
jgi:hypothetical protein